MNRSMFILMCLAFTGSATAQDQGEAIGRKLEAARAQADDLRAEARSEFIAAMTKQSEKRAERSDLEGVKRIQSEKQAFEADGEIPKNPFVALERRNYENGLDKAKAIVKKALETAKAEYTKAGMIAEAESIESEIRSGASPVVERVEKQRVPLDPIVGFWRLVIGERGQKQTIANVYFPPVDNIGVRSAMARRNQTSPVKYFQGSWSKSGDIYTLHGPNGATAKVKMGGGGEGFAGRMAAGAPVVGFRQQR